MGCLQNLVVKIKKIGLTSASTRKIAAVHGSCGASPAPSWLFPVTTSVMFTKK